MSNCKQCALPVDWKKVGGKWQCYNAGTDTVHWDACSKAKWDKVKQGTPFKDKVGHGFVAEGKKRYAQIGSNVITGEHFKGMGDCQNCVPPWEVCPRPCPVAMP